MNITRSGYTYLGLRAYYIGIGDKSEYKKTTREWEAIIALCGLLDKQNVEDG